MWLLTAVGAKVYTVSPLDPSGATYPEPLDPREAFNLPGKHSGPQDHLAYSKEVLQGRINQWTRQPIFLASSLVHHCLSVFRDPNTEKEMTQMNKTERHWSIHTNIGDKVERQ